MLEVVRPCLIPSCALHGIQPPCKAAARPGPCAQGEVEASVKKDFVFVYGVVPAAGHCVNAEGQCGTGVLVWKRLFFRPLAVPSSRTQCRPSWTVPMGAGDAELASLKHKFHGHSLDF